MDHLTREQRSANMSAVRGKDTRPEMRVRQLAHALGLRFRLHRRKLPGSPDLVFPKHRLAVFVHGCFWHAHVCRRGRSRPKTNSQFWAAKIARNVERDAQINAQLIALGWRVAVIWECETRDLEQLALNLKVLTTPRPDATELHHD